MSLEARFDEIWERSDELFTLIADDALLEQPIPLRQPFLFYLGHLPAFAWNQLREPLAQPPFRPELDALFARGIDPVGVDAYVPAAPDLWPPPSEVVEYRDRIRDTLRAASRNRLDWDNEGHRLRLGTVFEHERMHHETLLYMIQQLDSSRRGRTIEDVPVLGSGAKPACLPIPAGQAVLGAHPGAIPFGWDNEFPEWHVDVPEFVIDRLPVRNSELRAFLDDGGYERPELWDEDAWAWRRRQRILHPSSWRLRDGSWWLRTLTGEVAVDAAGDWPASVSWGEADAFARWRGARLPSEAEYQRAAHATPAGELRSHPWGEAAPGPEHGNFGLGHWFPAPVGTHPAGASAWGVEDLVGDGWEWTSTPFGPLPGFAARPNYPGYSQDFFDDRHYVMLGGSWATDTGLVRRSFRNWFQPHYPFVFSKFRCVTEG